MSTTADVRSPYCAGSVPVRSCSEPMKLVSRIGPRPETLSGSSRPLMRYWTFEYSLRMWKSGWLAAESAETPGSCRMSRSNGVFSPCGSASICLRSSVVDVAPVFGKMFSRALSNASRRAAAGSAARVLISISGRVVTAVWAWATPGNATSTVATANRKSGTITGTGLGTDRCQR